MRSTIEKLKVNYHYWFARVNQHTVDRTVLKDVTFLSKTMCINVNINCITPKTCACNFLSDLNSVAYSFAGQLSIKQLTRKATTKMYATHQANLERTPFSQPQYMRVGDKSFVYSLIFNRTVYNWCTPFKALLLKQSAQEVLIKEQSRSSVYKSDIGNF